MQNEIDNNLWVNKNIRKKHELAIDARKESLKKPHVMSDEEAEDFVAQCEAIDLFPSLRDDEVDLFD